MAISSGHYDDGSLHGDIEKIKVNSHSILNHLIQSIPTPYKNISQSSLNLRGSLERSARSEGLHHFILYGRISQGIEPA